MILVRVRSHHDINVLDAQRFAQVGIDQTTAAGTAAVIHHDLAVTLDNGSCALSYVQKSNGQPGKRRCRNVYQKVCQDKQHTQISFESAS